MYNCIGHNVTIQLVEKMRNVLKYTESNSIDEAYQKQINEKITKRRLGLTLASVPPILMIYHEGVNKTNFKHLQVLYQIIHEYFFGNFLQNFTEEVGAQSSLRWSA